MKKLILILILMLVMLGPQEGRSQNPRCEFDVITGPDLKGALGGLGLSGACTEAVYFDACRLARERPRNYVTENVRRTTSWAPSTTNARADQARNEGAI